MSSDPVLSGQAAWNSGQVVTTPTAQRIFPHSTARQPVVNLVNGVECVKSTENVTMATEQAIAYAAVTPVDVAMAEDNVDMTSVTSQQGIPLHSPPAASLSGLQPIKEVGVVLLDEPKRKDWDSILPRDPDSLLVRLKVQAFMHQYKERKETQRQQVAREWHAERMRQAAHMCATGVMEPSLLFPPQQASTAAPWTREDDTVVLNGTEEVRHTAVVSSAHEPYECSEQHVQLMEADGAVSSAVGTKDSCRSAATPAYDYLPPAVSVPSHSTFPPPPANLPPPPATSSPPPATSSPPPATSSPPPATSSPPSVPSSPPPTTLPLLPATSSPPPPPPNQNSSVMAAFANEEQVLYTTVEVFVPTLLQP